MCDNISPYEARLAQRVPAAGPSGRNEWPQEKTPGLEIPVPQASRLEWHRPPVGNQEPGTSAIRFAVARWVCPG
jgi:hypothetical protein